MNITQTAIKRGVTFLMIYLLAVGFGLFSLARLNVDLYPQLDFPVIAIITQYTGVGPYDIETVITRPVEETVAAVRNVKKVSSTSSQGLSVVLVEFEWGSDMDQAEIDVRNNLEFVRDVLPDDISKPLVFAFDPSMQPVMFLAVESEMHGLAELRRIAEDAIEPRLERVPGVASAVTIGGLQREIKVLVDPARLHAHLLSLEQIALALRLGNTQLPSGWVENAHQEFTIQTAGEFASLDEIANTNVASMNGSIIRIKDVATVVDGFVEQRQRVWNNDKPAVIILVQKQSDANSVQVCRELRNRFGDIEAALPRGVRIGTIYDQSAFINQSMANLGQTAILAIGLTFLVLLFFLRNFRSALIVAVSIPVSMVVTFAVMDQTGLTLNIISMAGLALAVGLLVDNSIVVLESIFRKVEEGEELRAAAHSGAREVAMAITASTLTTLSVFLPIIFVPGLAGELFNDMVVTICFSLTISLLVALTLIPLLASRLVRVGRRLHGHKIFNRIAEWSGAKMATTQNSYATLLTWGLRHRKTIGFSAFALFVLAIVTLANLGGEFLPENDMGFVQIAVDRSPGISLQEMEKSMRQINAILKEDVPEAENIYATFGQGEGVFAAFSSRSSNEGEVIVRLKKLTERDRDQFEIQDALRDRLQRLPDVNARFADRGMEVFNTEGDISIEIYGHDLEIAKALANEISEKVKGIKGVVHVESSIRETMPELQITFDRQRIADLGLSIAQIAQTVNTSVLGSVVTRYREKGDEYDVRVQLPEETRNSKEDLQNLLVMTPMGRQIPLRALASIQSSTTPTEIIREDQERKVSVNIDISGRDLRSVTVDVEKALRQVPVPNDFRLEIGGLAQEQQESFMYLGLALLVAVLLTYMVMASQFESLLDPFIILFTIPLSLIGVAIALFVTGTSLSVMALVGIIMLAGIVVNNGIVLVDYINQLRERGKPLFEAIVEAGRVRFRPVLLTALTTILAMVPLALGFGESGASWAPMARSVIGGLTAATALTLIVVPVIYMIVETRAEKIRQKHVARARARLDTQASD